MLVYEEEDYAAYEELILTNYCIVLYCIDRVVIVTFS